MGVTVIVMQCVIDHIRKFQKPTTLQFYLDNLNYNNIGMINQSESK